MPYDLYPFTRVDPTPPSLSDVFLLRLCVFYRLQRAEPAGLWNETFHNYLMPLDKALLTGDLPALRSILANFRKSRLLYGMDVDDDDNICYEYFKLPNYWRDMLIAACNAWGLLPAFNPEQMGSQTLDAINLVDSLEKTLACRLHHKGGGAVYGVGVRNRCITVKLLNAVVVWRELSRCNPTTLLEIGQGLGGMGHLFALLQAGGGPQKAYHSIDLPIITIMPACLFAANFGEESVWFYGEPDHGFFKMHGLCCELPSVDAAYNQDSLPEIPQDHAVNYVRLIESKLAIGGRFVSINQESPSGGQTSVAQLMTHTTKMRQLSRGPWWSRTGYLQEIWEKQA